MINEELQKEWNKHLKDHCIALGMPKFLSRTSYLLLELSSTISHYGLGIALDEHPPVALPGLYSDFIKAYTFSNFVMNSYLSSEGRKKLFHEYVKSELEESKEHLEFVMDLRTRSSRDR